MLGSTCTRSIMLRLRGDGTLFFLAMDCGQRSEPEKDFRWKQLRTRQGKNPPK